MSGGSAMDSLTAALSELLARDGYKLIAEVIGGVFTISATLFTALVTVTIWIATYYTSKKKEREQARAEQLRRYRQRQIEDFYGPLFGLVHQIFIYNHVQAGLVRQGREQQRLNDEQEGRLKRFFFEQYFAPLHTAVHTVLRTQLHLVEGADLPESFYRYLRHSAQERAQRELWQKEYLDTTFARGISWPDEFYDDVKSGLDSLMLEHQADVDSLRKQDSPTPDTLSLSRVKELGQGK